MREKCKEKSNEIVVKKQSDRRKLILNKTHFDTKQNTLYVNNIK